MHILYIYNGHMNCKILVYDNKAGIVIDALVLNEIVLRCNIESTITYINELNDNSTGDIAIWIQNFNHDYLDKFKINIFFINEEWSGPHEISYLNKFDYVVCKSKYALNLIKPYCNAIHLPFISRNFYDNNVVRKNSFLHFAGLSFQKNTELVLNQKIPITLIDPNARYKPNSNFDHINTYQTNDQISYLLNSHKIHICCSLYESWGHYLFEGLSTGNEIICSDIPVFREQLDPSLVHFIPTQEKINTSYMYCTENIYKFRKSFFVDEHYFKDYIENFKPIGKDEERRKLYKHIVDRSKTQMINFFNNI